MYNAFSGSFFQHERVAFSELHQQKASTVFLILDEKKNK